MRRCIRCTQWKDESEFNIRNTEKGYLQSVCKSCQQEQGKARYIGDPETVKEINRSARQKGKDRAKQFIYEYLLNQVCADCGESDNRVLTFDHVRGIKKYNIADMIQQGLSNETIRIEMQKTEVVCFNCHMRREQRRRGYDRFSSI
ncbi:MAG TPA: hypothetical protein VLZ89_15600 [Anaerolineales bacterium]|nr:hypothetical protein [Anaerolineales bacterium]